MKRRATSLLMPLFLLALATSLWASLALAADGGAAAAPAPTGAGGLINTIVAVIMPVVAAVGAWLASRLIKAFEKKIGIQLGDNQYAKLMDVVDQGIHFASEQAVKAGNKKLEGSAKLKLASDYANSAIEKWGLDAMASDKLQQLIEARLALAKADVNNELFKPAK